MYSLNDVYFQLIINIIIIVLFYSNYIIYVYD